MNTTSRSRRSGALTALAALTLALAPAAGAVSATDAAFGRSAELGVQAGISTTQSYCGLVWGSLAKTKPVSYTSGTLSDVRSGRHACFDRLVLDLDDVDEPLSYDVRYVDAVHAEGSGHVIPLAGGADLRIVLRAAAYDSAGRATYAPADRQHVVDVTGYSTFRQVAWGGSYERQTTVGLGVRARLPFRVLTLDAPGDGARLVIDVAHRW